MPDALRLDIENLVSTDERFRLQSSNDTLSDSEIVNRLALLATGDYIACISSSDCLDPSALFWIAQAQGQIKNCAVIYSDEDRIARDGTRNSPYFKPQFNYELLLSHNVLGSFTVFNRDLWTRLDGLDTSLASDSLYDLIFRAFEVVGANGFVHVPRILNHVAGLKGRDTADKEIVARHLRRTGRSGDVFRVEEASGYNRVRYTLPELLPLVTIIIPTRDRVDILKICVDSVLQSTTYKNFEIIIIDNGSEESKTFAYFETLPSPKVRVLRDNKPFNFSALNNDAVSVAWGDYVCLMNNDIEILTPGWLEEMMSFAIQPDIGCVGARLWYPDETIQHAGVLIGFHGVAGHMHKFTKRGKTGYADRIILHQSLSAVTAAVMLVKKALYEEVGGFDESLAVAFNDVDFCLKLRNAGYRNIYTPYAEMIHYESASRGAEDSPEKKAREALEIGIIKARYGESLLEDPAYNPNLSLVSEDLSLAFPPRVKGLPEILKAKKSTF